MADALNENLQLIVSTGASEDNLDALVAGFAKAANAAKKTDEALAKAASGINANLTKAAAGIERYSSAMEVLNKLQLAANPAKAVFEFGAALNQLGRAKAISSTAVRNVAELAKVAAGLKGLAGLGVFVRDIEKLSHFKSPSRTSIKNLAEFIGVLSEAKPIANAAGMARSLNEISAAAARTNEALGTLPRRMRSFAGAESAANRALGRSRAGITGLGEGLGILGGRFGLASQAGMLFATALSGYSIVAFVQGIFEANIQVLKLQKAMLFSSGTFKAADDAIDQYIGTEQRLGLSISKNADQFGRFTVAARTLGLDFEKSKNVWVGFETALGASGASSDSAAAALYGLTEMMNKGKVSAVQFTRQIGQQIHGSAVAGAEALSKLEHRTVSLGELFKQMRAGTIDSASFVPAWAAQMEKMYKPLLPLVEARPDVQLTKLANALFVFKREIGDGAFMGAIGSALADLTAKIVYIDKNGIVHLTASAKTLADTLGHDLATAIQLGGKVLQFLMDHIDGVTASAKLLVEVEVASHFLKWGSAAASAARDIFGLAAANDALNASTTLSFSRKGGKAAFGALEAGAAMGGIPKFTRRAGMSAGSEEAAIGSFMAGEGTSAMEKLGTKAAFIGTAAVGGAEAGAWGGPEVAVAFAVAAAAATMLATTFGDVSTGLKTKYGESIKYSDYIFGPIHDASVELAGVFNGISNFLSHFLPANTTPGKITAHQFLQKGAQNGDVGAATVLMLQNAGHAVGSYFTHSAAAQAHREALAHPVAKIPESALNARHTIEKNMQAENALLAKFGGGGLGTTANVLTPQGIVSALHAFTHGQIINAGGKGFQPYRHTLSTLGELDPEIAQKLKLNDTVALLSKAKGLTRDPAITSIIGNSLSRAQSIEYDSANPIARANRMASESNSVAKLMSQGDVIGADKLKMQQDLWEQFGDAIFASGGKLKSFIATLIDSSEALKQRAAAIAATHTLAKANNSLADAQYAAQYGDINPRAVLFHQLVMGQAEGNEDYNKTFGRLARAHALGPLAKAAGTQLQSRGYIAMQSLDQRADLANADIGLSGSAKTWTDQYRTALQSITLSTSNSLKTLEAQVSTDTLARVRSDISSMNRDMLDGIQKWVDAVKPFSDSLQDAKSKFLGGFADEITDSLTERNHRFDLSKTARGVFKGIVHSGVENIMKTGLGAFGLASVGGKADGSQFHPFYVTMSSPTGLPLLSNATPGDPFNIGATLSSALSGLANWLGIGTTATTAAANLGSITGAGGSLFNLGNISSALPNLTGGNGATGSLLSSVLGGHPDGSAGNPFYVVQLGSPSSILGAISGTGGSSSGILGQAGNAVSNLYKSIVGSSSGIVAPDIASDVAPLTAANISALSDTSWLDSALSGFASGGFTGPGGRLVPRGVVHAGEYVFNQDAVRRIGLGNLDHMAKGFADGGYVGQMPSMGTAPSSYGNNAPIINIVDQRSSGSPIQTKKSQNGNRQTTIDILVRDSMNRQVAGGQFDSLMTTTYGITRNGIPR